MALRIATNVPSITAQRALNSNQRMSQKAMAQVSTGSRITKAADDAAGLSISDGLKSDIVSYKQASRNTQDGISFVQVAEGALGETSNILTRFRELSIQASSDTIGDRERGFIQKRLNNSSLSSRELPRAHSLVTKNFSMVKEMFLISRWVFMVIPN